MRIKLEQRGNAGRFVALGADDKELGELRFREQAPGLISGYRTFVDPAGRGQGIAGALLGAFLEWARMTKARVQPDCSYIEQKMAADPSTHDLLAS